MLVLFRDQNGCSLAINPDHVVAVRTQQYQTVTIYTVNQTFVLDGSVAEIVARLNGDDE